MNPLSPTARDDRGPVIGLVHTVPALAGAFEQMLTEAEPRAAAIHVADAWLLRTAIEVGVDERVRTRVAGHAAHLASEGAHAVLLTCSSIGETASAAAERSGVEVVRVDAAMVQDAVDRARLAGQVDGRSGRIAVLATLDSTLGPTGRLVTAATEGCDADLSINTGVVDGAAAARAAGDHADHDRRILDAVRNAAALADVVILAQASMAAALGDAEADIDVPVLTSPAGGVRSVLLAAAARQAT